jgi:hypothetical protein
MDEIENIHYMVKKTTKTENKITLKVLINYSLLNSTFFLVLLTFAGLSNENLLKTLILK